MDSEEHIEQLEKVIYQLNAAHAEVSILAKKSPNDLLNKFKLKLMNEIISLANVVITDTYRPFDGFEMFEEDDKPSNSDVTMVLAQYQDALERFRSVNVIYAEYKWWYKLGNEASRVEAECPNLVGGKK